MVVIRRKFMTSKERARLRGEANTLEPIIQIGKDGITDAVIAQMEDNFNTRELFKVRVHLETAPETPKELAAKLAEAVKCEIIQVIGGIIVVFRINPILRQKEAEKAKRAKEKARREAAERRAERNRIKYSGR